MTQQQILKTNLIRNVSHGNNSFHGDIGSYRVKNQRLFEAGKELRRILLGKRTFLHMLENEKQSNGFKVILAHIQNISQV